MKKLLKGLAVILTAVVLVASYAPTAKAAAGKVIIHVKDGEGWGSMNVYNWGDKGETAGVWPGTEMKAEADGWFTFSIETEVNLNLVFSAKGGKPQSGDVKDVSKDAGEIWVVIGRAGEANDLGAATIKTELFTKAEEGWPSAAAEKTEDKTAAETTEKAENKAAAESTEKTDDKAAAETAEKAAATDVPKTGYNSQALVITFIGSAAVCAVLAAVLKKKEQLSEK